MKQSTDIKPGSSCHCGLPSLGKLQKGFLNFIAKLFYKHGKFVSWNFISFYFIINWMDGQGHNLK